MDVVSTKDMSELQTSDLEDLIGYNLKRAYIVVQEDFRRVMGPHGMSARVFSALSLVVCQPNITQSDLARKMGIERSGLVAIVDGLEEKNYLQRTPVPGDRRVQALVPTQAGRDVYEQTLATVRAHEAQVLASLTVDEQSQLLDLLRKIRRVERK